jgi:MFS family permease
MPLRALLLSIALGAAFFLITATTFASLGVVLPAMIAEFSWSWTTGGLGFTALALMTGVFSPVAATSLTRLGARAHYALAGVIMTLGYALMGGAKGVVSYLVAASLLGAGFALLANVPGTYLVGRAAPEKWRNIAIGAYLAAGGAGGVFGPLMANALISSGADWRHYWFASALVAALNAALIVALCRRRDAFGPGVGREIPASADRDERAARWTPKLATATPAFLVIAGALTIAYFCGVTVSTWSVSHLQNAGLSPAVAVVMLSLYSASNAGARALGGLAERRVRAKTLLVAALLANVVGMTALAFAQSLPVAIAFAIFDGFAFGMALFATTALLIDYFGLKNSPALLGGANLAATVAMLGPTLAGRTADEWGSFAPIFMIYAGAALVAAAAVAFMRDPNAETSAIAAEA